MSNYDTMKQFIKQISGQANILTIPRLYIDILGGDVIGALFLSQSVYWSDKSKRDDGWFYKSAKEWKEETGITSHQVTRIANDLQELHLIDCELRKANGAPTKHYRVNMNELMQRVLRFFENQKIENPILQKAEIQFTKSENPLTETTQEITTENNSEKKKPLDLVDGMLHFAQKANGKTSMLGWPADVETPAREFAKTFNLQVPESKSTRADWIDALRTIRKDAQGLPLAAIFEEGKLMAEKENWLVKIGRPAALIKSVARIARNLQNQLQDNPMQVEKNGSFYV